MAAKYQLPSAFLLLLVSALIYNKEWAATNVLGRVKINTNRLVHWANSTELNNGQCQVNYAANACEDVKIHFASSTAFLACGDPVERTHWYPPACVHDVAARAEASFREQLFKYDIKSGRTTELQIEGLDGDFVTHGIDTFSFPDDPSKIHIFAVRHGRDGDAISVFSHKLGSDVVKLVRDVKHPSIKTANGVAAVGPLEFYLTNDHYFASGPFRYLEEKLGPWSWATHVQHCDATAEDIRCTQVTSTFPGANGIAVWEDRMFVGDSKNGTITIYHINPDKSLEPLNQVMLGAAADNIRVNPITGDLVVSIFPTIEDLPNYLRNVQSLGKDLLIPAAALRLSKQRQYEPELLYFDNGAVISDMTAAAIDPYNRVFIAAGVLQYGGFAVCKLSAEATI